MSENTELETDWLNTQVELFKTLDSYKLSDLDKEEGYVDYVSEKGGEKKLLRVLITDELTDAKAYIGDIEEIISDINNWEVDEAVILAKRLSKASRRLAKNEGTLSFVSKDFTPIYSPVDLMMAVGKKVEALCTTICGNLPTSEDDCKGYENEELSCQVRRISDDADFHAEMQWTDLLLEDFSRLVELEKEHQNQ